MIPATPDAGTTLDRRVLIADDDATTRGLLTALVRAMGYTVLTAHDGNEAWAVFDRETPPLVIADWLMPGMNGLELCTRIREFVGDRTFVILATSRDGSEDLETALLAGADDYLVKPVTAKQLRARIKIAERRLELIRARYAAEEEVARMRWLAGIGQTVLTLQHEVNNPLTALYGSLEMLSLDDALPAHLADDVARALQQAQRIANVVMQLSTIKQHSTIELIPGLPMLALPANPSPALV